MCEKGRGKWRAHAETRRDAALCQPLLLPLHSESLQTASVKSHGAVHRRPRKVLCACTASGCFFVCFCCFGCCLALVHVTTDIFLCHHTNMTPILVWIHCLSAAQLHHPEAKVDRKLIRTPVRATTQPTTIHSFGIPLLGPSEPNTHTHRHTHRHTHKHTHRDTHRHRHTLKRTHTLTHTHTRTHTRMHTHTHTHTQKSAHES